MFEYFHNNKSRYEKGQVAPFFILIIVIIIIMAMVTLNLSKVSFIKAASGNAADAGALAAGSVMANVFNATAQANSQLQADYWEFYAGLSLSFAIAMYMLTKTISLACAQPCLALAPLAVFIKATYAIIIAITAFHTAQYFLYRSIRKSAEKGRESAIVLGHKFAFINSALGSKLKEGSPADDADTQDKKNNYRDTFNKFLDAINEDDVREEYIYRWQDGQDRGHFVKTKIDIEPVDDFKLQVTALPLAGQLAFVGLSLVEGYAAKADLITACAGQVLCYDPFTSWIGCPLWAAKCASATATLSTIYYLMGASYAGLLPGYTVSNNLADLGITFIICWINDIKHNHLARLETTQHHEGEDLGLWRMRYPDEKGNIDSYSLVNFTGRGKIYPPVLRHDSTIVETDSGNVLYNPCILVSGQVSKLEAEVTNLDAEAGSLEERALGMYKQVDVLNAQGSVMEAQELADAINDLKEHAQAMRDEAGVNNTEIAAYKQEYKVCFE